MRQPWMFNKEKRRKELLEMRGKVKGDQVAEVDEARNELDDMAAGEGYPMKAHVYKDAKGKVDLKKSRELTAALKQEPDAGADWIAQKTNELTGESLQKNTYTPAAGGRSRDFATEAKDAYLQETKKGLGGYKKKKRR